jgi:crossover junction endodeoxyribonuclease RuvC
MAAPKIILGLDPGLGTTGWGVIRSEGNRLSHIANGQIKTDAKMPLASRLLQLDLALSDVLKEYRPDAVAVEEVFVNMNPQSTLKLGQARGVVLLGASRGGAKVAEYATRLVKKAIVGECKQCWRSCCPALNLADPMRPMRLPLRLPMHISAKSRLIRLLYARAPIVISNGNSLERTQCPSP